LIHGSSLIELNVVVTLLWVNSTEVSELWQLACAHPLSASVVRAGMAVPAVHSVLARHGMRFLNTPLRAIFETEKPYGHII
jgi:hypothetical protein